MAESTIADLTAQEATPISGLPAAMEIYDSALFVLQFGSEAYKVTGAQLKSYAVAAAQNVNKGADGITPHIGNNGNWYIGDKDTKVRAVGEDGDDGITPHIGSNGNWFIGNVDTGVAAQGPSGSGTGDMLASVYDRNRKRQDIFSYVDNMVGNVNAILDEINGEVV